MLFFFPAPTARPLQRRARKLQILRVQKLPVVHTPHIHLITDTEAQQKLRPSDPRHRRIFIHLIFLQLICSFSLKYKVNELLLCGTT